MLWMLGTDRPLDESVLVCRKAPVGGLLQQSVCYVNGHSFSFLHLGSCALDAATPNGINKIESILISFPNRMEIITPSGKWHPHVQKQPTWLLKGGFGYWLERDTNDNVQDVFSLPVLCSSKVHGFSFQVASYLFADLSIDSPPNPGHFSWS